MLFNDSGILQIECFYEQKKNTLVIDLKLNIIARRRIKQFCRFFFLNKLFIILYLKMSKEILQNLNLMLHATID